MNQRLTLMFVAMLVATSVANSQQIPASTSARSRVTVDAAVNLASMTRGLTGENDEVLGGGLSVDIGAALRQRLFRQPISAHVWGMSALVGPESDQYTLNEFGVRFEVSLEREYRRFRPLLGLGASARFATTLAADGLNWQTASAWSPTATVDIGVRFRLGGPLSLQLVDRTSLGGWSRWSLPNGNRLPSPGTSAGNLGVETSSLRLGLVFGR